MIHTIRTITVGQDECVIDRPIMLYRGDRDLEVEFSLVGNSFMFGTDGNVLASMQAKYAQLVVNTPSGLNMFSDIVACRKGNVIFTIRGEMIDEIKEVGMYAFQIRLLDAAQTSRVTLPPVYNGIEIRQPIAAEDQENVTGDGVVDYAEMNRYTSESGPTFNSLGDYNKTTWQQRDVISTYRMNKIEDALYQINEHCQDTIDIHENQIAQLEANYNAGFENVNKNINERIEYMQGEVNEAEVALNAAREHIDGAVAEMNTAKEDMLETKEEVIARVDAAEENLSEQVSADLAVAEEDFQVYVDGIVDGIRYYVYPEMFGAVGDGVVDDTLAFNNMFDSGKRIKFIKNAVYRVGGITRRSNVNVESEYDVTINLFKSGDNPVLIGFGDNSTWKNVKFISLEEDLEWNRGDVVGVHDINIEGCTFEGFRHISDAPNSWGLYLENATNITIKNCIFENNTQSDISIVDGCTNIIVDNCQGSNFHINIEPNGSGVIDKVHISNCNLNRLNTLENSFTCVNIEDVLVSNCNIERYHYRGGNVTMKGSTVKKYTSEERLFMGRVDIDSLVLSRNLIPDEKLMDIGNTDTDQHCWTVGYSPDTNNLERIKNEFGTGLILNPGNANTFIGLSTSIDVIPGGTYCFRVTSAGHYPSGASWIANHGFIAGKTSEGATAFLREFYVNQTKSNTSTDPSTKYCFVTIPDNVTRLIIRLMNTKDGVTSTSQITLYNVGLFRVAYNSKEYENYENSNFVTAKPSSINAAGSNILYLVGDKVYLKEPTPGGYMGYVCVESGNPGIWKGFGSIES